MKLLIFFLLLTGFLTPAYAGNAEKCFLKKYKAYTSAQKDWQAEITKIIKKVRPDLGEVAELYRQDQLILIEKNRVTVELLLKEKPDRVQTSFPPNRWIQLTNEDINFLKKNSEKYVELSEQAEKAGKRVPHPDKETLHAAMRTEIIKLPKFQKGFAGFMETVKEIEDRVCGTE